MRFIKFAAIGLLILFLLLTGIGLLMPPSVTVLRSVEINAPVDSIRYYTHDIAHWKLWINGADTAYFKQLTPSTTINNAKVVLGNYTITLVKSDPKYINALWQSNSGSQQLNRLDLYNSSSNTTLINWSFQQELHWYPWERLSAMLHDKVFGPSMEESLAKLKKVCEKN